MELRSNIPRILLRKLVNIRKNDRDAQGQRMTYSENISSLMDRLVKLLGDIPKWREKISEGCITSGMQESTHSTASRSWITKRPTGWMGRDYVRAIQASNGNFPTAGIKSNPPDKQMCRAGCNKKETICHVHQACLPLTGPRSLATTRLARR